MDHFLVVWGALVAVNVFLSSVSANSTTCPTWYYYDSTSGQCLCGAVLYCNREQDLVEILQTYCATSAGDDIGYYIGKCPLRHTVNNTNRMLWEMPSDPDMLDEVMCGPFNRKGFLCGECIDGYGPAVYSLDYKCANCSTLFSRYFSIPLYLLLELTPITFFFIFLIFFNINITSGPLLGYIVFCQVIACFTNASPGLVTYILSDVSPFLQLLFQASLSLCQFWSMHWFFISLVPPFCLSEKLTGIHIQLLPLLTATYPVVLVIITYILMLLHVRNCRIIHILWKPFSIILNKTNITAVASDAVIHAFASFIFLSYLTVYYVVISVSSCDNVTSMKVIFYGAILYFDPAIKCFSHQHLQYIPTVALPFIFLTIIPSILLMIYPTRIYSRCLSRCLSARKRLAITAFAEALHFCFKDGLNGTRDYRALAGLLVLGPIIYFLFRWILDNFGYQSDLGAVIIMFTSSAIISYVRPCKQAVANLSISFHLMMIGIICIAHRLWVFETAISTDKLELTFIFIPLLSHLLVFTWIGYTLIHNTMKRLGYQFNTTGCREMLADLASGLRQRQHCMRRNGYHSL